MGRFIEKGVSKVSKKNAKVITESPTALANRSKRDWPHNAIYEIITCGCVDQSQPMVYEHDIIRGFNYVLKKLSRQDRRIWECIFRDSMSILATAEALGMGHTTVREHMTKIYRTKEDDIFLYEIVKYGIGRLESDVRLT